MPIKDGVESENAIFSNKELGDKRNSSERSNILSITTASEGK
jgi:hypothetical protein